MENLIKHLEVELVLKIEEIVDDFNEGEVGSLQGILEDKVLLVTISIGEVAQDPCRFEALRPE